MVAETFGTDGVIVLLMVAAFVFVICAVVSVWRQPRELRSTGSRIGWTAALVVGWYLLAIPGVVLALMWFLRAKPRQQLPPTM